MQPFASITGIAVPLVKQNVDTDQLIPKQFLKRIERTGYGEFLFFDWRFKSDGSPDPAFVLNQERFAGASIVLAGRNFGCGSSREHAVWALMDFGIRVVIAPSFADIFASNAAKNGLLTIALDEALIQRLAARAESPAGLNLTVSLQSCTISQGDTGLAKFHVDEFRRRYLLEGLDDIALTLQHEAEIAAFEKTRAARA
jgi:3-isopropylmalate/(R)-2-methylmalate dehydratase small subunit